MPQPRDHEMGGTPHPRAAMFVIKIKRAYLYGLIVVLAAFAAGFFIRPLLLPAGSARNELLDDESITAVATALFEKMKPSLEKLGAGQAPSQGATRVSVSADDDPALGARDAPVLIVAFSDFQCSFCKRFFEETFPQLRQAYIDAGKVRFVYRDFPLQQIHPNAQISAEAAECADEQGKFWEMHGRLLSELSSWSSSSSPATTFKGYAQDLGLDVPRFASCLDSHKYLAEVQNDYKDGTTYGVSGTPSFFINGLLVRGAKPLTDFQQAIEAELAARGS